MTLTASTLDELTLSISQEIRVKAPLEATFDALLEELGPHHDQADGCGLPGTAAEWDGKADRLVGRGDAESDAARAWRTARQATPCVHTFGR